MQWKERLNVEVSLTGEKYHLIFYKIYELLQFECIWACLALDEWSVLRSARITQWKERFYNEVSQTGEKYRLILLQNRRTIAICVYLGLY